MIENMDILKNVSKKKPAHSYSGKNPCYGCGAECCKYIAIDIPEPEDIDDYDVIIWYLHHQSVTVYIDKEHDWYVHIEVPCKHIGENGDCSVYEKRSNICRDYTVDECERYSDECDTLVEFETVEEFENFFKRNYETRGENVVRKYDKELRIKE